MNNSIHEWTYTIHRRDNGNFVMYTHAKARSEESARKQIYNRFNPEEYEVACQGRWDE